MIMHREASTESNSCRTEKPFPAGPSDTLHQGGLLSVLIDRHGIAIMLDEASAQTGVTRTDDHSMHNAKSVKGSKNCAALAETPRHLI
ncbi:MAG: hypothetical protein OJF50_002856 [Nitrospira sp.]|nr:hypothetical protein [Nitrospira sp.]